MKEFFEVRINNLRDYLASITDNFSVLGIITEILDVLLVIGLIILIIYSLRLRFKRKKLVLIVIIALLVFALAYFLSLTLLQFIIKYLAFWLLGLILIIYNQEIRRIFDKNQIFLVEKNRDGVSSVIPLKKFGSKDTRGNIKDKLLSGMYNVGVPYISELDLDEFKQNNKKSLKVFFNKLNLEQ